MTQHPLFLLETGQLLCMGFEPDQCPSCIESINKFTDQMKNTLEKAKAALSKSKDQRYYNQRQFAAPKYQPGDKVYIDVSDIQTTQTPKKLSHKCLGPFLIERQVGNSAYHLNLPASMSRLHPVFNVVKLTPAMEDPPQKIINGEEEWVVEEILDSKIVNKKLQYLIKNITLGNHGIISMHPS